MSLGRLSTIVFCLASLTPAAGGPIGSAGHHPIKTGHFLVARRHLEDPFFSHSVVLLLEHGRSGTVGVIVNRKTGVLLGDALPGIEGAVIEQPLYFGGPVDVRRMSFISQFPAEIGVSVADGLYFSGDLDSLNAQLESPATAGSIRVLAGYAAWVPGQLAMEIERGDWYVMEAVSEEVFHDQPEALWQELIDRLDRPRNLARVYPGISTADLLSTFSSSADSIGFPNR